MAINIATPSSAVQENLNAPDRGSSFEVGNSNQAVVDTIPPIRWIMVGYFFWVGIFLGALFMHSATGY